MSNDSEIHAQLKKDCHLLGSLQESTLLLHKNSQVPWFILVPRTQLKDFLDLDPVLKIRVLDECSMISQFVRDHFGSPKINFAAIGNLVPQMHLHVVGRHPNDSCWPHPVWGNLRKFTEYDTKTVVEIVAELTNASELVPNQVWVD